MSATVQYSDGQQVHIGDLVDVGAGSGPIARVVVIISTAEAAAGFKSEEWAYLQEGVLLENTTVFGLLHVATLDHEFSLVERAQVPPHDA